MVTLLPIINKTHHNNRTLAISGACNIISHQNSHSVLIDSNFSLKEERDSVIIKDTNSFQIENSSKAQANVSSHDSDISGCLMKQNSKYASPLQVLQERTKNLYGVSNISTEYNRLLENTAQSLEVSQKQRLMERPELIEDVNLNASKKTKTLGDSNSKMDIKFILNDLPHPYSIPLRASYNCPSGSGIPHIQLQRCTLKEPGKRTFISLLGNSYHGSENADRLPKCFCPLTASLVKKPLIKTAPTKHIRTLHTTPPSNISTKTSTWLLRKRSNDNAFKNFRIHDKYTRKPRNPFNYRSKICDSPHKPLKSSDLMPNKSC